MAGKASLPKNGRRSIDATVKSICDIMRRGNMSGALQYVPELSRLLFLRILDEIEESEQRKTEAVGKKFSPSLPSPFRWRDWAAKNGKHRQQLTESKDAMLQFYNNELLPHLHKLRISSDSSMRQKIIGQIFLGVETTQFDTQRDMLDVLDRIDELRQEHTDDTHIFTLSQIYEGLLLKMGEKNNDGGQFFTPRETIRAMVRVINPQIGETVYDPCCGTGGFLAQSNEYMREQLGKNITAKELTHLRKKTFYGREKDKFAYPIALANLILHGIDAPRIWHGNTLSRTETDGSLFLTGDDERLHDVILTNPPFGGKESRIAQTRFDYPTSSTQVLFMQEIIKYLKNNGRCGVVVDEGFLFRGEDAFAKTKKRMLEECNLWCIVSLPSGVFTQAGAGVKTNLLFFTKGEPTEKIWYYDMSDIKVNKGNPLTLAHFDEFFRLLPRQAKSQNSWLLNAKTVSKNGYDLRAKNPNKKDETDNRTPAEIMDSIRRHTSEIGKAMDELRDISN